MDSKRFDELSKLLGTKLTRSRFFTVLSALAVPGTTRSAHAERGNAAIRMFKNKNRKGKKKKRKKRRSDCPPDRKNKLCHCPPGLGGQLCFVVCVGTGGGHENDEFDCMCGGNIPGVPDCGPGRCPVNFPDTRNCSVCIPDGFPAAAATECCSGIRCAATGRCGACTCAATCTVQTECTGLGVANCVCRTLEDSCGPCIPDGQPAGSAAECCSGIYCPGHGICGTCPPLSCDVPCQTQQTCIDRGAGCVCRTQQGQCGPCFGNGEAAGSAAECCTGTFCPATGQCGDCVCAATCTGPTDCTGLGVADCICRTLTGQCGGCIPDRGPAGSAAECCSGTMCGPFCGACPPQICAGACGSDATCQLQADQCVCFASGTCGECLTTGSACSATNECCGQLRCIGGQCKIAQATGGTKGKRGARGCTRAGQSCRLDGECCAQSACFQGKCGEKNSHCHHTAECAKGYRCVGGRSIGDHRRCRKNGSKKYHRKLK